MVSPDAGGVERARAFARRLNANLAIIDKRRRRASEVAEMRLVGEVKDAIAILVDDMIDTAGTITEAAKVVVNRGRERGFRLRDSSDSVGPGVRPAQAIRSLKS